MARKALSNQPIGLDAIAAEIDKLAAIPFKGMLAHALYNGSKVPWAKLARTKPLDYIKCVKELALLAGYTPEAYRNQQPTILVVEGMSDHALVAALAAARAKTLALPLTLPDSAPESPIYDVARIVPASSEQESCQPPVSEASSVPASSPGAGATGSDPA